MAYLTPASFGKIPARNERIWSSRPRLATSRQTSARESHQSSLPLADFVHCKNNQVKVSWSWLSPPKKNFNCLLWLAKTFPFCIFVFHVFCRWLLVACAANRSRTHLDANCKLPLCARCFSSKHQTIPRSQIQKWFIRKTDKLFYLSVTPFGSICASLGPRWHKMAGNKKVAIGCFVFEWFPLLMVALNDSG